jgi:hypothetical protein
MANGANFSRIPLIRPSATGIHAALAPWESAACMPGGWVQPGVRVVRWRGPVAIHLAFFRDNQMLAPLAKDGGGPIPFQEGGVDLERGIV